VPGLRLEVITFGFRFAARSRFWPRSASNLTGLSVSSRRGLLQPREGSRAPDAGEDYTALAKKFPTPPASAGIIFDGDEGRLGEQAFLRDFAGDLPEAKAKVLYAVQEPFQKALLTGRTNMAKRMGAKTIEVKASHLSLISHPDEIAALILEATQGT
jgi:hypothetical protein